MKKILLSTALAIVSIASGTERASAQDFYIGQIIAGGWNFCPRNTAPAAGQLLAISTNTALFSLLGTQFGGDGRTTFALPDLRGHSAIGSGQAPGLNNFSVGQKGGTETHTLTTNQMPSHTHTITTTSTAALNAAPGPANAPNAAGNALSNLAANTYASAGAPNTEMETGSVSVDVNAQAQNTGGSQAFGIRDPYLAITYCVVTQGIFPSRS